MTKRKIDSSMDDIIMEYFKKVKCEKTSKKLGTERSSESDHEVVSKSLERFVKFVKENEMKKEIRVEDDLGFEINFGAFQPVTKVSFSHSIFHGSSHKFTRKFTILN